MTEFSGTFTGRARVLSVLSLSDVPGHELHSVEVTGAHSSPDEKWNNAHVTYWAVSDLVAGNGSQRGYYLTERNDGSRDFGSFEGKVATVNGETIIEGSWRASDGTGIFAGIRGEGVFKTRLTSPMDAVCSWQGRYELAATAQAA